MDHDKGFFVGFVIRVVIGFTYVVELVALSSRRLVEVQMAIHFFDLIHLGMESDGCEFLRAFPNLKLKGCFARFAIFQQ